MTTGALAFEKPLQRDLRATWTQALVSFLSPIFLVVLIRILIVEPFVIPSGSMIPTLLVHDHILAEKWAYGLHVPGIDAFVLKWANPKTFDIVVFRYPKNPDVFFVKRVIGLPGDEISVHEGNLKINGKEIPQELMTEVKNWPIEMDSRFAYFNEAGHVVRFEDKNDSSFHELKVPAGFLFVMGDNRDQSSDSRVWGFVPINNLIGRVSRVWLSCRETLPSANYICNPQTLRWDRILISVP